VIDHGRDNDGTMDKISLYDKNGMRIELIIFGITALLIANLYTEGKYLKLVLSWKKYWQMAGIAVAGLFVYWLVKKNPANANQIILASNEYIKYLPIDKGTTNMITPILDFTSKQNYTTDHELSAYGGEQPILPVHETPYEKKVASSGKNATKRSVSETKKKFVAARQGWRCGDCQQQLNAWFEVDHRIRLEYGGSNHVDNLLALCRECHGKKTAMENL